MPKIKEGDKLVCINNKNNDETLYFTIGKSYEIIRFDSESVHLRNDYLLNNYFMLSTYSCAANLWDFFKIEKYAEICFFPRRC